LGVGILYDESQFAAGERQATGLIFGFEFGSGQYRTDGNSQIGFPAFDIWIDDLTSGEEEVFRGSFAELGAIGRSELQEWLHDGHDYRIFVRNVQVRGSGPPGQWSDGHRFSFLSEARLAPLRDATSFRDAGFRTINPAHALARYFVPIDLGSWQYRDLQGIDQTEIEITNLTSGEVVERLVLTPGQNRGQDLGEFFPDTPTLPGRYAARLRTRVWTADPGSVGTGTTAYTAWSAPVNFNIYVPPVQVTGGTGSTIDATPTISWSRVTNAASYEVWIGRPGENQPVYQRTGIRGRTHEVATALPDGDYNVWVRAHLVGVGVSAWGDAASLTIGAPPVLQQTAARTVSWNAVNGATRYEIWVDSLGGASQPGAQVVHETTWRRTTYSLNRSLPAGEYRVWVRAIRTERREVYRSAWSASLTIQVADVAANGHSDALSFLPAPLVRPMLSSIANAGLQYPDAGRDPVRVNPDSHPSVSTQESMEVPIPGAFVVAQVREHEARLIDLAVTGSLAWLS